MGKEPNTTSLVPNYPTPQEHLENQQVLSARYINYNENRAGKFWTQQEDEVMCEVMAKFGKHWRKISQLLPGRTIKAVQHRWADLEEGQGGIEAQSIRKRYINQIN